jgi:Zn-dependent protease with chaperone function
MFEWFYAPYARLLQGLQGLLVIPGTCGAPVDVLRALTLLLCAAAGARIWAQCVADRRLRGRSPVYGRDEFAALYDLYREAGARVGVKRLPPLHRHADEDPLAFTTGCFRPAVFLAPALVRSLGADELRAVLVHELVHVRQRDNLRALLGSLLPIGALVVVLQVAALYALFRMEQRLGFTHAGLIVAAVLTLLWTFRSVAWPRVVFRRELSCDDRVVEALQSPLVVAASLVQVWRLQRALPRRRGGARLIHALPLLRSGPSVEERVRRLIDYRPGPRRAWLTVARRALAAAAVLWTSLFLWNYHSSDVRDQLAQSAPEFFRTFSPPRR